MRGKIQIRRIERLIELEWGKSINNYSDAHWRADSITRLEAIKRRLTIKSTTEQC